MSRFGELLGGGAAPAPAPEPVVESTPEPIVEEVVEEVIEAERAKDEDGQFISDDPSTPENEAWVGGVAPTGKKKRLRRSRG